MDIIKKKNKKMHLPHNETYFKIGKRWVRRQNVGVILEWQKDLGRIRLLRDQKEKNNVG